MRKPISTFILLLCVLFGVSFLLLGVSYHALPSELPVLRIWIGNWKSFAPKSPFTVFRVALMNLIHGLLAAIMFFHARDFEDTERRTAYSNMFSTLLLTVALKSNFEALELSLLAVPAFSRSYARELGFGTLASVIVGIGLALLRGRRAPLPWPELCLITREKFLMGGLFSTYLTIVILSLLGSRQA